MRRPLHAFPAVSAHFPCFGIFFGRICGIGKAFIHLPVRIYHVFARQVHIRRAELRLCPRPRVRRALSVQRFPKSVPRLRVFGYDVGILGIVVRLQTLPRLPAWLRMSPTSYLPAVHVSYSPETASFVSVSSTCAVFKYILRSPPKMPVLSECICGSNSR